MNSRRQAFIMERTYFPLWFRLDHSDHYLIWSSAHTEEGEDADGVVIDAFGHMPYFRKLTELSAYAASKGYAPLEMEEPVLHDLDCVVRWLKLKKMKRAQQVNCDALLAAWNLFADISRSLDGHFDSDPERTERVYRKLFWGTNPPAMTPQGCHYTPRWPSVELEIIHEQLSLGLRMFRSAARRK
jgi:hypothetical protein